MGWAKAFLFLVKSESIERGDVKTPSLYSLSLHAQSQNHLGLSVTQLMTIVRYLINLTALFLYCVYTIVI